MSEKATGKRRRLLALGDPNKNIVDETVALAEEIGWSCVRLHLVAERLDISLAELQTHFCDLDAIANAWFERALQAMLAPVPDGFAAQTSPERLHLLLMRWFDALALHRTVSHQMLNEKLYLSHPHHWVPMIFNLSRIIQWLRDAALLNTVGRSRKIEEIGLSALFLAALAVWCRDDTQDQEKTRQFLERRLSRADFTMGMLRGIRRVRSTDTGH